MDKKDNIQELFNNRFSDFEADVDSQVWDNIQSELANTGGGSSTGVEKSIFSNATTWVAAVGVSAILGVGYVMFSDETITEEPISSTETVSSKNMNSEESSDNVTVEFDASENKENIAESVTSDNIAQTEDKEEAQTSYYENDTSSDPGVIYLEKVPASTGNSSTAKENSVNVTESENEVSSTSKIVEVEAATPNTVVMASQSSVLAMPMGGMAPLEVTFSTLAENPVKIKWDFDDGNKSEEVSPNHVYQSPGIYFVTMIAELESGEVVMDKAVVEVKPKVVNNETVLTHSEIKVGNVFTPNSDGDHDELVIICKGMQSFSMSIYSVNGQLVYQTENPSEYWNGTDQNGQQVEEGTYYYLINAIGEDQNIYAPKGYISVYR